MKKPLELRQYLEQSVRGLKQNPERLQIFIDRGKLNTNLQPNLHFSYAYNLNIIVTDLSQHPDAVFVPLLAWLRYNQIDLEKDNIEYDADIIDHETIDLSINVPMDERVLVHNQEDGNYTTEHLAEPHPEYLLPDPELFLTLFANEEQMTPDE